MWRFSSKIGNAMKSSGTKTNTSNVLTGKVVKLVKETTIIRNNIGVTTNYNLPDPLYRERTEYKVYTYDLYSNGKEYNPSMLVVTENEEEANMGYEFFVKNKGKQIHIEIIKEQTFKI